MNRSKAGLQLGGTSRFFLTSSLCMMNINGWARWAIAEEVWLGMRRRSMIGHGMKELAVNHGRAEEQCSNGVEKKCGSKGWVWRRMKEECSVGSHVAQRSSTNEAVIEQYNSQYDEDWSRLSLSNDMDAMAEQYARAKVRAVLVTMGAGKTLYGVPRDACSAFEDVIRVQGYYEEVNPLVTFAILGEKTTVISPEVLIGARIPCCRLVQNVGEFIVTFPGSYHSGFSHGFN